MPDRRSFLLTLAISLGSSIPCSAQSADSANGLVATPFAQAPLKNITAVHVDHSGNVFAVESQRRKGGEWTLGDREKSYGFQSINEKRAWLDHLTATGAEIGSVQDNNGDGKKDARDLQTNSEVIHLLKDRDGDGKADHHQVFAEGFNDPIDGIGAGVMSYRGDVFFTCFPNLWRLRDKDGDGSADEREILHTGFAIQLGQRGHDLHGLTIGPYGRLYWSLGDRGFSVVRKEDGKRFHYPYHGAVVRCELDGSNFEVFATGLRNNFEMAFDMHGNLISADNDGDMKGELERLVYILEGSDHGWRRNWQFQTRYNPWMAERMFEPYFKDQPAHITPAIANFRSGPCGFAYEPGTALNDYYRGCFFMNFAPAGKLFALRLVEDGAAFRMLSQESVLSAGTPTGMNFGPDGALYLADWAGAYERNDKGGIYKLDDPTVAGNSLRKEVQQMLASGMQQREIAQLARLLHHADMRIRMEAQFELARRKAHETFSSIAQDTSAPRIARIHALWGIAQSHRQNGFSDVAFIHQLLTDFDPEIRLQTAKTAREIGSSDFASALTTALNDPSPRVKLHAAMALGRCGSTKDVPALFRLLQNNNDQDAYLRFGAVLALSEIGDIDPLAAARDHSSPAVRAGAVLALRRLASPAVANFLKDSDPRVTLEAARAIHDDQSIVAALPKLASLLDSNLPADEALQRRVINANVRTGGDKAAQRLARLASLQQHSLAMRLEALDCLLTWTEPEIFDRVEGSLRRNPKGTLGQLISVLPTLIQLTNDPDSDVQAAATEVINRNRLPLDPSQFLEWLTDSKRTDPARLQAFQILTRDGSSHVEKAIDRALTSDSYALKLEATRVLQKTDAVTALTMLKTLQSEATTTEQRRQWIRLLGDWSSSSAESLFLEMWNDFISGTLPAALRLDLIDAASRREEPAIANALADYKAGFSTIDPLAPFRDTLSGGNALNGEKIFQDNVAAQCVRCHRVGGDGSNFGPDLEHVSQRLTPEQLLESLISPSATIAEGYALVTVLTKEENTIAGTLHKDSDTTLELTLLDGSISSIPKASIAQRSDVEVSTMPPMGAILTPMQLRDVLAYLQSLR